MPRDGSGVYSAPAGTLVTSGTAIESAKYNAFVNDLVTDANLAVPVLRGGTGASSASAAQTALGLAIGTDVLAYDAGLQQIADLADPNADRVLFWDDSAGAYTYLTVGTNLTLSGTTLSADAQTPADGSITFAKLAGAAVVTASETIESNDNDTTIPTSAAVKDYTDAAVAANSPVKAWANFSPNPGGSGTYSRTGTTITATHTSHGMTTGQGVLLDFTSGTATDGWYFITVTDANTYTVTDAASGSTSGNFNRTIWMRGGLNIGSIAKTANGIYTVTMASALADAFYAISVTGASINDDSAADLNDWYTARVISSSQFRVRCYDASGVAIDGNSMYCAVFR